MTKKCVIKNCPAFCDVDDDWDCISRDTEELKCQNYTDCILKRIVEKTKKYINDEVDFSPEELLSMLEIEECEE